MDTKIGASVLRILGDVESGEAPSTRMVDAYALLDALLKSEDLRSRCASLSSLVQDASVASRQTLARSLVILLTSKFEPLEEPPRTITMPARGEVLPAGYLAPIDHKKFRQTTPQFAAVVCPTPGGKWKDHVEASYSKRGVAEWAKVSPYLHEIISSIEALVNVQGHLLSK